MPEAIERNLKTAKQVEFATLPEWAMPETPDVYSLASVLELAGLGRKAVRLTASDQRRILGFPVFGKRLVRVDGGDIYVTRKVCFGTDFETLWLSWQELADRVRNKRPLC